MSPHRVTPEGSPEPDLPHYKGLWQATTPKHKRSWHAAGVLESGQTGGIRALWENEWRSACQKSTQPFQDGDYGDFEPIFNDLIEGHVDDPTTPEYTLAFLPKAHELALEAENALHHGKRALATGLYLRACAVLRIARYPSSLPSTTTTTPRDNACPVKQRVWQFQKSLYLKAGRLWESPLDEVIIPHIHDAKTHPDYQHPAAFDVKAVRAGDKLARQLHRPRIPLCIRLPMDTLCTGRPCPVILILTGDRTAHTRRCGEALGRGWGCVVVEVPGAGDCPVSPDDERGEEAADQLWSSVLDWMEVIRVFNMDRVVVWGLGEAVVRMAGTHGDRLRGCVAELGSISGKDLHMLDEVSCRLLLVTDGDSTAAESNGLWTPAVEEQDEGRLALFEYGVPGTSVVQYPVADTRTVHKWMGDILG